MLETLHRHYKLGLVSDGFLDVQRRKLVALGLGHYFDAIVFSDEWGRDAWKPSTKPFEVVLQQLKVHAAISVYVADNPVKDFVGARRIGMLTIQVRRLQGEHMDVKPPTAQHAPDLTITSLAELEKVLTP